MVWDRSTTIYQKFCLKIVLNWKFIKNLLQKKNDSVEWSFIHVYSENIQSFPLMYMWGLLKNLISSHKGPVLWNNEVVEEHTRRSFYLKLDIRATYVRHTMNKIKHTLNLKSFIFLSWDYETENNENNTFYSALKIN